MTKKKSNFNMSEAQVMLEIKRGPKTRGHFVDSIKSAKYKSFMEIIKSLKEKGKIREITFDSMRHFVTSDWEWTDEFFLKILQGRCRRTKDGCLEWAYKANKYCGPTAKLPYNKVDTPIRKITHKVKTGEELESSQTIKTKCGNEKCIEFSHFEYKKIGHAHIGKKHGPITLKKISESSRKRFAKLDIEKVKDIRQSKQGVKELAEKYDVSTRSIRAVINGEVWRDNYGMFSGLIRNENRSAA